MDMVGPSNIGGQGEADEAASRGGDVVEGPSWNGVERNRDSDDEGSIIQELRQRVSRKIKIKNKTI